MNRRNFIKSSLGIVAITTLSSFIKHLDLNIMDGKQPVLFIGHGSPMNTLEDNEFTNGWKTVLANQAKPKAVLCISAHWETNGTFVTAMEKPKTIHDFGGFPQSLYDVEYPANGSKWLANVTQNEVKNTLVGLNLDWGLDHGTWSVLKHLFPNADVPVVQLSLDKTQGPEYHYKLAKELAGLRAKGVLIVCSGNMVHNFQHAKSSGDFNAHFGHDWALEANETFKKLITERNHTSLLDYQKYSKATALSAPTPEHYLPMLYAVALQTASEEARFFNDAVIAGSFSMTSLIIQ